MYILYKDYKEQKMSKDDSVLMSAEEFAGEGKGLKGVPVTITSDGSEPVEPEEVEPDIEQTGELTEIEKLKEQIRAADTFEALRQELGKTGR